MHSQSFVPSLVASQLSSMLIITRLKPKNYYKNSCDDSFVRHHIFHSSLSPIIIGFSLSFKNWSLRAPVNVPSPRGIVGFRGEPCSRQEHWDFEDAGTLRRWRILAPRKCLVPRSFQFSIWRRKNGDLYWKTRG